MRVQLFPCLLLWTIAAVNVQLKPGTVFREYGWLPGLFAESAKFLHMGENILKSDRTLRGTGRMMRGMGVQYPDIRLKMHHKTKQEGGVNITTGEYEGREHFVVTTPSATYYYDRAGGGFSRILDADSQDWVAFRREPWDRYPASAASAYRGIPNLVFRSEDGGAGHPGHDQCTSEQIDGHSIRTVSKSGKWAWTWRFFDTYARLDVQRVDPDHAYWFLYEGVPGGTFEPAQQYFGTSEGGPYRDQLDYYRGNKLFRQWRWAYFGHLDLDRILYVAQLHPDEHSDTFSYLGNSEAGIHSEAGMVVFGFGRAEGAQPLITSPNTFFLGFHEARIRTRSEHKQLAKKIDRMLRRKSN